MQADRLQTNSFGDSPTRGTMAAVSAVDFSPNRRQRPLRRPVDAHPFVPQGEDQLRERCEEIFHTQVAGLAKRLEHIGKPPVAIGVSGGLDSTLALLVTCKTFDLLSVSRPKIQALTMPGFGTTARTKATPTPSCDTSASRPARWTFARCAWRR